MCREIEPVPQEVLDLIIQEAMNGNYFNYLPDRPAHRPSVFPRAEVTVITLKEGKLVSEVKKWGYEVSWNKDVIYNTRADTAVNPEKMWFDSLQNRRCIVPVFGFFEPHQSEKTVSEKTGKPIRQKYYFSLPGYPIMFLAGIYENDHFSIMTTEPNQTMKYIHNRMPLMVLPEEIMTWLNGDFTSLFDRQNISIEALKAQ